MGEYETESYRVMAGRKKPGGALENDSTCLDILCQIKILLNLDETSKERDAVLAIMIQDAAVTVQSYCHLKSRDIPQALKAAVRDLVIRRFNAENGEGVIESVKRGDTQVNYATPISAGILTDADKIILNAHRRLVVK